MCFATLWNRRTWPNPPLLIAEQDKPGAPAPGFFFARFNASNRALLAWFFSIPTCSPVPCHPDAAILQKIERR